MSLFASHFLFRIVHTFFLLPSHYNKAVGDLLLCFVAILINIIQKCRKLEVDTGDQPGPSGIQVTSPIATQASTSQAFSTLFYPQTNRDELHVFLDNFETSKILICNRLATNCGQIPHPFVLTNFM